MLDNLPRLPHKLRNDLRDLHRAFHRDEQHRYLAEGPHLCEELLSAQHAVDVVVIRDDASEHVQSIAAGLAALGADVYACGEKDMQLTANAAAPQSILARAPFHEEHTPGNRLLILDTVSDPGNVGTIIRCATWFGFSDVVLGDGCADVYNPKTMRSTAGAALRVNVLRHCKLEDFLPTLRGIPIVAAIPRGGEPPSILSHMPDVALVIGSESHGIHNHILQLCTHSVSIPGLGNTESLNAAMATTVLAYEARRLV